MAAGSEAAQPERSPEGAWAKGRILVMPKAGLSQAALRKIVAADGGSASVIGGSRLFLVSLPGNASETAVAARLARHPLLKFAEVDRAVSRAMATSDPFVGSQWHLAKINAALAWDVAQGSGVTIAVLDSGAEASHPDLASRLVPGWNFWDNNADTADVSGHGTRVAGSAAAALNNATGVASVAGQARIMPLRISTADGTTYLSTIVQALTYAADKGARVANISFSAAGSTAVQSAAQYMKDRNGLVFVSAGNSNANLGVAASSAFIVVSATDANDAKASWSNYGDYVHLAAPGVAIYTTTNGNTYAAVSGTSFSAPVAAGVAALAMSANPGLSSTQIERLLFSTAKDLGAAGRDPLFGHGRVDAAAAVQAAVAAVGSTVSDTQLPSAAIATPLLASTVSGLTAVNVTASDNVGVSKVELRVNGALLATDTMAPYGFSWDSGAVPNGTATLIVTAYDAAGNTRASAPVTVTVSNGGTGVDSVPPTVGFASPSGTTVAGNVTVSTSASDNSGTTGLKQALYINGTLVAITTGASLNYKWNTTKLPRGIHTLLTVATDAAGNQGRQQLQVIR